MTLLKQLSRDLKELVARTVPSVVGIEHSRGQGTGFVVAEDGYILTNRHVVGSREKLKVRLSEKEVLEGSLVGSDAPTDLAVVRVAASGLPSLRLADARPLEVGEIVVAIGNPYHFERSVSLGVVSALDRTLPTPNGNPMEGLIQTDAAVNPGNSGGPLVDAWGEVVGINTAIVPFAQGIGFAISARTASWVTALLIQRGSIDRPYLGIAARGETLSLLLSRETGQARGVRVLEVQANTPAASARLQKDDLLLALDGMKVFSVDDLQRLMVLSATPEMKLEVWRGGARRDLYVRPKLLQAAGGA